MIVISEKNVLKIVDVIKQGAIVAIPTDTIYGLVCQFNDMKAINKIYQVKNRQADKPLAILVKDWKQAQEFGIFDYNLINYLINNFAEGQITVIVNKQNWLNQFEYWKDKKTIAIRVTFSNFVRQIIAGTGPLVATSFNLSNELPINDWQSAQAISIDYFIKTDKIVKSKASTIYDSINKKIVRE